MAARSASKRKATVSAPFALIQHLATQWTKASRGGAGAVKRNGTPEAMVFPCFLGFHVTDFRFRIYEVRFTESAAFVPIDTVAIEEGSFWKTGCLRVVREGDILLVRFEYDGWGGGAPTRETFDAVGNRLLLNEEAFRLRVGQWGRVSYNGRFSCVDYGNWWYEKHVFNVGMALRAPEDWFTRRQPDYTYSRTAQLR
jgi:hypothetical protein